MRLEVVRQKDAQQRGGARTLLAPGAVRGDARGDEGRDRDGHRDADPQLEEEVARPHDVERDPGRDAKLVEVVDVQEGVGHPSDERPVQGLVDKDHEGVVEHDRPDDGEDADADGARPDEKGPPPPARAAVLLASAQPCTPIPRRS